LAKSPDHLRMTGVTYEEDMAAVLDQPLSLAMDFRDERTGRIHELQAPVARVGGNGLGDAVRRKNDRSVIRNLIKLRHKNRAHVLEPIDHEAVMDDLVAHVDRGAETLERKLDDLDRAVDAGAEATGGCDQQAKGWRAVHCPGRCKASLAGFEAASYDDSRFAA